MRKFRYRVGWFGVIVLQVWIPNYTGSNLGEWRDARLQDISWGELAAIKPHQPDASTP